MKLTSSFPASESVGRNSTQACVGVFPSLTDAHQAVKALCKLGISKDKISIFIPGPERHPLTSVATSDTEQGGMGAAMAGSILGALGLGIGVILFVPVIGPVSVVGVLAAGLSGVGGVAAGALVGATLERMSLKGLLPVDEVFVYESALAQGRTIVLVAPEDHLRTNALDILKDAGAESIDAAAESWGVGLRDWCKLKYTVPGAKDLWEDPLCRQGFELGVWHEALGKGDIGGKSEILAQRPEVEKAEAFWLGYSAGRNYAHSRKHAPISTKLER